MLKTQEEIRARCTGSTSFFGFDVEALIVFLEFEMAEGLLKPETTKSEWDAVRTPLTRENVIEKMRDYMEFAITKASDHRGISAGRSVEKMSAWVWALGDEPLDDVEYPNYGAPVLKAVCKRYGFPWPDDDVALNRMAEGRPCSDECADGCSLAPLTERMLSS